MTQPETCITNPHKYICRSFDFSNELDKAPLNIDLLCYCHVEGRLVFRILVRRLRGWTYNGGLTDPPLDWARL